jgi:hypothetical protein
MTSIIEKTHLREGVFINKYLWYSPLNTKIVPLAKAKKRTHYIRLIIIVTK